MKIVDLRPGNFRIFKFYEILVREVFECADSEFQLGFYDFGHLRALARARKNQNRSEAYIGEIQRF